MGGRGPCPPSGCAHARVIVMYFFITNMTVLFWNYSMVCMLNMLRVDANHLDHLNLNIINASDK